MRFEDCLENVLRNTAGVDGLLRVDASIKHVNFEVVPSDSYPDIRLMSAGSVVRLDGETSKGITVIIVPVKSIDSINILITELIQNADIMSVCGYYNVVNTGMPNERLFKKNELVAKLKDIRVYDGEWGGLPNEDDGLVSINAEPQGTGINRPEIVAHPFGLIKDTDLEIVNLNFNLRNVDYEFTGIIDNSVKVPYGDGGSKYKELTSCLETTWKYVDEAPGEMYNLSSFLLDIDFEIIPYVQGLSSYIILLGEKADYCIPVDKDFRRSISAVIQTFAKLSKPVELTYYKPKKCNNSYRMLYAEELPIKGAAEMLWGDDEACEKLAVTVKRDNNYTGEIYDVHANRHCRCGELVNALINNVTGYTGNIRGISIVDVPVDKDRPAVIFEDVKSVDDVNVPATLEYARVAMITGHGEYTAGIRYTVYVVS